FITHILHPLQLASPWANGALFYGIMALIYVAIGITESIMARFRMNLIPKFILTSFALVFFATILTMGVVK
ncbi:MAG: hydrogenase, partial [Desulfobulbaceae bacterium]|nr:hydrogenase [Desulfobulbaceae bacterium]